MKKRGKKYGKVEVVSRPSQIEPINIRFQVCSALKKEIRTTEGYWRLISEGKHPIIRRYEKEVKETLQGPDEIRKSKRDGSVYLYYKKYVKWFVCVLVRHLNGEGYVITAYLADKIKKGDTVWKKK